MDARACDVDLFFRAPVTTKSLAGDTYTCNVCFPTVFCSARSMVWTVGEVYQQWFFALNLCMELVLSRLFLDRFCAAFCYFVDQAFFFSRKCVGWRRRPS